LKSDRVSEHTLNPPTISYNTFVESAEWDDAAGVWNIKGTNNAHFIAKYFVPCLGFGSKRYVPNLKNLDKFKGTCSHTADWPLEGIDTKDKRVAVIGTGASGVQVIQEIAGEVKSLVVFQRTPNLALPMQQKQLTPEEQLREQESNVYTDLFSQRWSTVAGLSHPNYAELTFNHTPEERRRYFDELYSRGGFAFWASSYADMLTNQEANTVAYNYWRDRTRERIRDPKVAEMLAPTDPPHAICTKRPSLEQRFYEIFNQPNVELVQIADTNPRVKATPIVEITETGIRTTEKTYEFDIIVLATGFDSVTGGLTQIDVRGKHGRTLREDWANGVQTNLGMSVPDYPNLFFDYGPQGPCAFANGPPAVEMQGDWIAAAIDHVEKQNKSRIEPTIEAGVKYAQLIRELAAATLFVKTKSWYMGANIPGKAHEMLMYVGGLTRYKALIDEVANNGYEGFTIS
jgi:cation diffusion facilitator CzcD-associated flavoprotein CzcO